MSRRRRSILSALKCSVPRSARVLVAVSGGRDSMALLHGTCAVSALLKLDVGVCHIDHGFRPESSVDAEFVRAFCSTMNVSCHVVRLPPLPKGENLEAWAREQRYAAFATLMAERGYSWCLTGHNSNDVAETLVMRLLSNKEPGEVSYVDTRRKVIRPFLEINRAQIDDYVRTKEVPYRDDPTNESVQFLRNRVRHRVLPLLCEEFGREAVFSLSERAAQLAEDGDELERLVNQGVGRIGELVLEESAWLSNAREQLKTMGIAIQWRVVSRLFVPILGYRLGWRKAKGVLSVLLEHPIGSLDLDGTTRLSVERSGVHIRREPQPRVRRSDGAA